jgi:ABC-2 type transport system ATP-binding protein
MKRPDGWLPSVFERIQNPAYSLASPCALMEFIMENALSVRDLSYIYGSGHSRVEALNGVSLEVPRGEIFGFIGPNGAGKTTTIKHLLGIIPCVSGKVKLFGKDPSRASSRSLLGYMPENAFYYNFLTPMELLRMYGDICFVDRKVLPGRVDDLLEMVGLGGHKKKRLSTFSKGMMQKVSFAQALVNDPELLILDEPTGGLDPVARKNMREIISGLKKEGKTVFFSSHELSEVELVADRIGVLNGGRMVASGAVKEVMGSKGDGQSLESYFLQLVGEDR